MEPLLDFYQAHPFWIWMAIGAALLAAEVVSGSGWLLWPAASAVAVGVLTLIAPLNLPWEILIFAGLTIVSTLVSRRFPPKGIIESGPDINDPLSRLVGRHGKAVQAFAGGEGRVFIDGKEWAAEFDGEGGLAEGEPAVVVAVDGARLRVRRE